MLDSHFSLDPAQPEAEVQDIRLNEHDLSNSPEKGFSGSSSLQLWSK